MNIMFWLRIAFCLLCCSSLIFLKPSAGTVLIALSGIIALPIKAFGKLKNKVIRLTAVILVLTLGVLTLVLPKSDEYTNSSHTITIENIPEYSDCAYVVLNNNTPDFAGIDGTVSFEEYSPLDSLGRCGEAIASVGVDLMPTDDRGSIGSVKPSGWHTVKYDNVPGKYLYNRCHLIAYQLSGENSNELNLITGTRYLNVSGMLPFENMVADYVHETNNHVLYRATPIFKNNELVARGVVLEAYSVEDNGAGICFNIYAYNVQPGITINYLDGSSYLSGMGPDEASSFYAAGNAIFLFIFTNKVRRF